MSLCVGSIWTLVNRHRDQCALDIGIVACVAYALAASGLLFAARRRARVASERAQAERLDSARLARRRARVDVALLAASLCALGGQIARSASLAKVVPPYPCECHQKKSDTPLRMF